MNLGFRIFRFPNFPIFNFRDLCLQHICEKSGGEISRNNNKGVLYRPWTKRMVLMAISSTLKFQFTGNHENEKIRLFGETEHRRPGVYKVAQGVSAQFCLAKTPSVAIWGQQIQFVMSPYFFPGSLLVHLWEKKNHLTFQDRLLRFSDFQFSRFCSLRNIFEKYVGEISRNK